ncbi:VTT domain-containing protein [Caenibacillus caldisaponilyticus]|uniref:VTT domain-containing protein n=1 Tax=Caenibacillus caldisaponilyticus TaxID=1674942 RepID=UPI0009885C5A|nr:VTT domain-containing protein [Caenibacillus caldisaponilyticus]
METFLHLVNQYGAVILFVSLMLELIALPIPTEPMMSYVGYLVYQGQQSFILSILAAALGSFTGMNVAYWIGRKLGYPFFKKHGDKFHLGPERLDKVENIFRRHGAKFLLIVCFIPGLRHLSGYVSGISRLSYRRFAIFSALGVILWTTTFIGLGDLLGPQWMLIEKSLKKYIVLIGVIAIAAALLFWLVSFNLGRIKAWILSVAERIEQGDRARFRLKLLITCVAIVFIFFVSVTVGLIQDYFGRDFDDFNRVFSIVFWHLFRATGWGPVMRMVWMFASPLFLFVVTLLAGVWIVWRSRDSALEIQSLALLIVGGFMYMEGIRHLFRWLAQWFHWSFVGVPPFPDDRLILATLVYGFSAFIVSRHAVSHGVKMFNFLAVLMILIATGLAGVYFGVQPPSGIIAGYMFGGVWLSFVILILEIARLLRL